MASVAKSGWLNIRTGLLIKSWKRRWFVLYSNGELRRYDSEEDASRSRAAPHDPERTMLLRAAASQVLLEPEARELSRDHSTPDPFEGQPRNSMFAIELRGEVESSSGLGKLLWFCSDDSDDALAWKLMLEDARTMQPVGQAPTAPPMPPAYSANPSAAAAGSPPGYYYMPAANAPAGTTVYYPQYATAPGSVMVVRDPYYYGSYYGPYGPYCYHHRCYSCHCHGGDLAMGMVAGAAIGSMLFMPLALGPLFWC